jgi:hypothetical protein
MIDNPFFITGMLRSGTTLLQNILNSIPQLGCSNQQMTELLINAKKTFLHQKGLNPYHVLSNYFPAVSDPTDFDSYLNEQSFLNSYIKNLNQNKAGNKEVLAEEFIPYLSKHLKTILIVRNPNDVITSLRFGKYKEFVGEHRPLLFDIRNWRKSVAFAIKEQSNPNFLLVKYEDLVTKFHAELDRVLSFILGIETKSGQDIKWKIQRNSSFEKTDPTISTSSINNYTNYLSPQIQGTIEYLCYSEMKYLNYACSTENEIDLKRIEEFRIYNLSNRPEFEYFDLEKELEREELRLSYLKSETDIWGKELKENFIFEEVYRSLKKTTEH